MSHTNPRVSGVGGEQCLYPLPLRLTGTSWWAMVGCRWPDSVVGSSRTLLLRLLCFDQLQSEADCSVFLGREFPVLGATTEKSLSMALL